MKRITLFVLFSLLSCQEMPSRGFVGSAASVSSSFEDLSKEEWLRETELCDLADNCDDVDKKLVVTNSMMTCLVTYKGTLTAYPGATKNFVVVSHSNSEFKINNGTTIVTMTYSINGNVLELCEKNGACEEYFR